MSIDINKRESEIKRVLLVTLFFNLFSAFLKLWGGIHYAILTLTASGVDSVLDGMVNVIAFISIRFAFKPADDGHHYGHDKYENLGALVIAASVIFSAFELGLGYLKTQDAFPLMDQGDYKPFVILFVSMMMSKFVSVYEGRKGKELGSKVLLADSEHTRADFFLSFAVLVGILGRYLSIHWLDTVIGVFICVYLVFMGIKIIRANLPELMDASPDFVHELEEIAARDPEVLNVHNFRARGSSRYMFIDFHILVNESLSLKMAHEISHRVEAEMKSFLKGKIDTTDITIHVEPYEAEHDD